MMELKKDPLTEELFLPKRLNQKFANRQNQIRYNNKKAAELRILKSEVDKHLKRNREILYENLGETKEKTLSKDYLKGAGFHFGCLTHQRLHKGIIWHCVYDHSYRKLDNGTYRITKHT